MLCLCSRKGFKDGLAKRIKTGNVRRIFIIGNYEKSQRTLIRECVVIMLAKWVLESPRNEVFARFYGVQKANAQNHAAWF